MIKQGISNRKQGEFTSEKQTRLRVLLIICAIAAVVFISRLPFISAGYGDDPDAWRMVNTAHQIASTGNYAASRLPGYPIPEFTYSLFRSFTSPILLNGLVAMLTAIGSAFFALTVRKLGLKNWILAAFTLAFVPVIYTNSTCAMDYIWSFSFLMAGLYFVVSSRPILSGIMLGLAIGSRLTYGAMIIPCGLMIFEMSPKSNRLRNVLTMVLTAGLVGLAAFAPVLEHYGLRFFCFCDIPYPTRDELIKHGVIDVWGEIGRIAILFGLMLQIVLFRKIGGVSSIQAKPGKLTIIGWILAVVIYVIAFLRLPIEAGYLIPMVPFVILLLAKGLDRRIFAVVCVGMIAASFISLDKGVIKSGPIFEDHAQRMRGIRFVDEAVSKANELSGKNIIVAGRWLPQIECTAAAAESRSSVKYTYMMSTKAFWSYRSRGYKVYFLPGSDPVGHEFNIAEY